MFNTFKIFIDLCIFRARPEDLPSSAGLLRLALAAYLLTCVLLASGTSSFSSGLLYGAVNTLILIVLTHTLLLLRRQPARLPQTLTALAGTGALLGLLALPLGNSAEPGMLVVVLLAWSIAVSAHILRHALSTSLLMGILASIGYLVITFIVVSSLFPALTAIPATP